MKLCFVPSILYNKTHEEFCVEVIVPFILNCEYESVLINKNKTMIFFIIKTLIQILTISKLQFLSLIMYFRFK